MRTNLYIFSTRAPLRRGQCGGWRWLTKNTEPWGRFLEKKLCCFIQNADSLVNSEDAGDMWSSLRGIIWTWAWSVLHSFCSASTSSTARDIALSRGNQSRHRSYNITVSWVYCRKPLPDLASGGPDWPADSKTGLTEDQSDQQIAKPA